MLIKPKVKVNVSLFLNFMFFTTPKNPKTLWEKVENEKKCLGSPFYSNKSSSFAMPKYLELKLSFLEICYFSQKSDKFQFLKKKGSIS